MTLNRRSFLKASAATALTTATMGSLASTLASRPVLGANTDGYKALVCVFFFGGLDNHDTLIPYDQSSYDRYAQIRASLISQHSGSRDRSSLLELSPDNASAFDNRSFALPPQFAGIKSLFDGGELAIVGNVGPLIEAVNSSDVETGGKPLPRRLFSHNDQQSTWQASAPEGAQFGWGGLFADAAIASGANASNDASIFTTITGSGNQLYLTGHQTKPYPGRGRSKTGYYPPNHHRICLNI